MKSHLMLDSMESISFQKDNILFNTLAVSFGRLKGVPYQERQEIFTAIEESVFRRLNLRIKLVNDPRPYVGAMACLMPFTKDHPLMDSRYKNKLKNASIRDITEESLMDGTVDLINSRVGGYFSEVVTKIVIFDGMFGDTLDGDDIAAVSVHEIGHIFTYFEMAGKLAVTNAVLQETAEMFSNSRDPILRKQFLSDVEERLGHKFEDKDSMASSDNVEVPIAIVAAASENWVRSELGQSFYDQRTAEFMADQFAARHGAARQLVVAIDKIKRSRRKPIDEHFTTMHLLRANLLSMVGALALAPAGAKLFAVPFASMAMGGVVVGALASSVALTVLLKLAIVTFKGRSENVPSRYAYDDLRSRYLAVRRELISSLKDPVFDKPYAVEQLKAIEGIDSVIGRLTIDKNRTSKAASFIYDYLNGSYKEMKFQRQYEEISNNDLFLRAAQLKSLG